MNTRRGFLQTVAAAGAALAKANARERAPLLPTVEFGGRKITKLIIGSNPFLGYGHSVPMLDHFLREWFTPEHRMQTLARAEQCGLNTWQISCHKQSIEDVKAYRAAGGSMNILVLADYGMTDWSVIPQIVRELKPIGIAHHGNRTDERLRAGQMDTVHDFVKAVRDAGVAAGISCHNPEVVQYVEDHGWANDYYMTCLYRVSRNEAESRAQLSEAPLGEVFLEKDPERMTEQVRKTGKTCFAFKLLAAGRNTKSPASTEQAFRYALRNIKPGDAAIVGMCLKFRDEVQQNAELVRRILEPAT